MLWEGGVIIIQKLNNFSYTELSVILLIAMSIHFLFNKYKKQKTYKI